MTQIISTAEPFLFPGSRTGCLLVHGFTGTPKEMRWMGEYLAQNGFSVLGVRLFGHATRPDDMIRSRWTDWVACVEDSYNLLRGLADRVYLVGLSMGGALALLMSTRVDTKGVVAISTPIRMPNDPRLRYLRLLSMVQPYMPKGRFPPGYGWYDKKAWEEHISYPQNPLRAVGELNQLLGEVRFALPNVRVPVLLVHSQDDGYVPPANMDQIYAGLTSTADKSMLLVKGSGHVVTRDAARQQVFDAALSFILRVESGTR